MITSRTNPLIKRLRGLQRTSERSASCSFLAEGVKIVGEALDAGHAPLEVVVDPVRLRRTDPGRALADRLARECPQLTEVSAGVLETLSDAESSQGVIAVMAKREAGFEQLLATGGRVLVAVEVRDPGNLGALLRVAEGLAAVGFLACGTVDPWNPKVVRAAAGSLFRLPLARVERPSQALLALSASPLRIVAAVSRGGAAPTMALLAPPCAIVLGSEARGLDDAWIAAADVQLTIPLQSPVESLNVATAAAILLYAAAANPTGDVL